MILLQRLKFKKTWEHDYNLTVGKWYEYKESDGLIKFKDDYGEDFYFYIGSLRWQSAILEKVESEDEEFRNALLQL